MYLRGIIYLKYYLGLIPCMNNTYEGAVRFLISTYNINFKLDT